MKELILEAQALIPFLKTADMATRNGLEKLCKTTARTISELVATNEALTAKLAKAMTHVMDYSNDPHLVQFARTTLAEIEGEKG